MVYAEHVLGSNVMLALVEAEQELLPLPASDNAGGGQFQNRLSYEESELTFYPDSERFLIRFLSVS
jgi:hypothetical protein